ncbi:hypothetical protein BYT27DRAFT_7265764 [Phlegmacium glaucopus]|nr:hypothetical protein BYT27DRAFT_7265764 [Phlegmacium glaucopus]
MDDDGNESEEEPAAGKTRTKGKGWRQKTRKTSAQKAAKDAAASTARTTLPRTKHMLESSGIAVAPPCRSISTGGAHGPPLSIHRPLSAQKPPPSTQPTTCRRASN